MAQPYLERNLHAHELAYCERTDVKRAARQADVIIPIGTRVGREELEESSVRLVQQFGAGLESVDIEAASKLGVYVANIPSDLTGNAQGVAEIALGHMLILGGNLLHQHEGVRAGNWKVELRSTLAASTVALVGFGTIGRTLARLLRGFGCELLAISRRGPKGEPESDVSFHGALDDLPAVLARSDYAVIATPLNDETRGMFGKQLLAAMKPGAFLINVARGGVVDYDALCDALASGQLGGAGLDVFWTEPFPAADPIFQYNVIGTPHLGGATFENMEGITQLMAENVDRVERGEAPNHCVNLDQLAKNGTV